VRWASLCGMLRGVSSLGHMQREDGDTLVRRSRLMTVIGAFLIGCAFLLVVGCSGDTGSQPTGSQKSEDSQSAEADDSLPQNGKIAFSGRDGNIYTVEPDGSSLRQVTSNLKPSPDGTTYPPQQPAWSPDGTKIAYSHVRQLTSETQILDVYVMNADGSGKTNLTRNKADGTLPAWSPDGTRIAFSSIRDSGDVFAQDTISDIYTMDTDGSDVVRVTKTPLEVSETQPDWQPLTP
jgi:hypothetical protein